MPALDRYQGRFFQTLGKNGKELLINSNHHTLFISGLYGLIRPLEPIQLYSCPLKAPVADIWFENEFLTEILKEYINRYPNFASFRSNPVAAYRYLIDWSAITKLGVDVLHCFDIMSAGDYSLIPFANLFKENIA